MICISLRVICTYLANSVDEYYDYLLFLLRMGKTLDRLTLLETFIRIAERGSISAAASDLGLSQPSASRQLAELETRFGLQLIRRTTHSMALTAAGQALLRDAREIVSAWNSIEERHGLAGGLVKGPLRVVAPVAL